MLISQLIAIVVLFGLCFATFGALGRLWPCNPRRPLFVSRSIGVDLAYGALGLLYAGIGPALVMLWLGHPPADAASATSAGRGWLVAVPLAAQVAILLVTTDFAQYWVHRGFHHRRLWPVHAVHHAAPDVNWTTTFRTHPINYLVSNTALSLAAQAAGFSGLAMLVAGPVFFFSGAFTHANLGWSFGPLRYLVASPVFHRWHHSAAAEDREHNFAPMFPVWDLMFGTFYMPRGKRPDRFGAEGVPVGIVAQLLHPFRSAVASARRDNRSQARPPGRFDRESPQP